MRILVILPRIFAGLGIVLAALTMWLYVGERAFIAHATHTTGTVVDLTYETHSRGGSAYYPVVVFTDARGNSITIHSHVGSNPPSYQRGQSVEVLYDPARPEAARISGFFQLHIGSFITGIFALVWSGIGGIWIFIQRRAVALAAELRQTGLRIQAKVIEIERRTNIRVGATHPWRIVAQGTDAGGEARVYRSANIWFDPTKYVKDTVSVFVDRDNPRRHVVDLDFLPKPPR